jgi:hypothetical protein
VAGTDTLSLFELVRILGIEIGDLLRFHGDLRCDLVLDQFRDCHVLPRIGLDLLERQVALREHLRELGF